MPEEERAIYARLADPIVVDSSTDRDTESDTEPLPVTEEKEEAVLEVAKDGCFSKYLLPDSQTKCLCPTCIGSNMAIQPARLETPLLMCRFCGFEWPDTETACDCGVSCLESRGAIQCDDPNEPRKEWWVFDNDEAAPGLDKMDEAAPGLDEMDEAAEVKPAMPLAPHVIRGGGLTAG